MRDLTAIYYTAHLEDPAVEQAVRETHLESAGDIPIVSVSQQPLDFGTNICVGDVGISDMNAFRQLQIGIRAAKTKYVCNIEADFLYPPEYFQLVPARDDVLYIGSPLYVLFCQERNAKRFYLKGAGSEGAIVADRLYLLSVMDTMLRDCPEWAPNGAPFQFMFKLSSQQRFRLPNPILTFKTDNNMGRKTPFRRRTETFSIPYWGTVDEVFARYHLPGRTR